MTSISVRKISQESVWYLKYKFIFFFALFTCISMAIGILTVCFTSPKQPGMFFLYLSDIKMTENNLN
jgi:hypothetical protein